MLSISNCQKRSCKHYRGVTAGPEATVPGVASLPQQRHYCAAFPAGIPNAIVMGSDLHGTPHAGDHGIQYEKGKPTPYAPIPGTDD